MRMTVSRKLILGFVVVLVMMALLGGLSVTQMNQVNQKTVEIESKWLPAVKNINELTYMIEHLVATDLKHVVSTEPETMKVYEEDINKTVEAIQTAITNYGNTIILEEEKKIYPNLVAEWEWYLKIHNLVIEASKKMEKDFAVVLVQDANERFAGIKATLDSLVQVNAAGAEQASQEGRIIYQASIRGALLLNLAAVVVGLIIAIVISRKISQPVRKMAKLAEQIAQGNLQTEQIVVKSKDEIGNLAEAFNQMAANLRSLVLQVSTSTHQVASSAEELLASADQTSRATEQIASTIQEVAAGSEQQSESVLESTKTVVEMAAGAHQIAEQAQTVAKSAIQAAELSQEGNESIQTAISQINSVHHTMNRLAEVIKELGNRSEEITQIVEVISGIAAQTNLLALNAAIEAARAGENGRGFAVVANEVRMLAEQSSASAQQITILIQGIQAESKRAVNEMNVGTEEVAEGIQLVDSAGEAFGHIQHSINQVAEQIQQVSAAAEQMSASTEHVVQSIRHISKIAEDTAFGTQTASAATQEQLSSMEEIASSASALSHMADELQAMIGKFRT